MLVINYLTCTILTNATLTYNTTIHLTDRSVSSINVGNVRKAVFRPQQYLTLIKCVKVPHGTSYIKGSHAE